MNIETAMTTLTCMVGVMVSILLAGLPWAYCIHGRLTKIETTLKDHLRSIRRIGDIELRLTRIEVKANERKPCHD